MCRDLIWVFVFLVTKFCCLSLCWMWNCIWKSYILSTCHGKWKRTLLNARISFWQRQSDLKFYWSNVGFVEPVLPVRCVLPYLITGNGQKFWFTLLSLHFVFYSLNIACGMYSWNILKLKFLILGLYEYELLR